MTQKLLTRIATQSDTNIIANIDLAFRKKYIYFASLIHTDANIRRWIHDILIPSTQVWVVEQDDVMIGMMAVNKKQGINFIEQLYLLPESTMELVLY